MLKNYLKIAFRNLKKYRFFNTINILGLSLAIAISVLLFSTALREFSYDQFHANKNDIHLLYFKKNRPEGVELSRTMAAPIVPALKEEFPELKATRWMGRSAEIKYGESKHRFGVDFADEDFFSMFSFPVIKGNTENPLTELNAVVLNEETATIIFGDEDPIGQILPFSFDGRIVDLVVTAIIDKYPAESTLNFNILTRFENSTNYQEMKANWDNSYHEAFIQLPTQTKAIIFQEKLSSFTEKYFADDIEFLEKSGSQRDETGAIISLMMHPLTDIHFAPQLGMNDAINKIFPIALLIIGFFVVLIACINYVNLTISTSLRRSMEVGLRKVMGANRGQLMGQFWGESLLIVLIALVTSLTLIQWILPEYNAFFKNDIDIVNPFVLGSLGGVLLLITLGGGIYPAMLLAKFQPANVLKGTTKMQKPGILRNALVVIQFAIAVLLISNTLILNEQLNFFQKKSLGFNKEQVVSVPLHLGPKSQQTVDLFRNELANHPEILSVSATYRNFGKGKDNSSSSSIMTLTDKEGKEVRTHWHGIDYNFFETMDIDLVAGKDFQRSYKNDTIQQVIINETLAKKLNRTDLIGSFMNRSNSLQIIGIAKDFHFEALDKAIEPVTMVIDQDFWPNYLLVKVTPEDLPHTMAIVERSFKKLVPNRTFRGSLLDENTNRQYQTEAKLSQVFIGVSIFAIFLSCLGLLGIAIMTIVQRTKEVGIRKILGATTFNIVGLLSKDFLKLVLIATFIGIPLSWYGMSMWLQEYHYRTELHWWIFALAGIIAISIAFITVSFQTFKAALSNPIDAINID